MLKFTDLTVRRGPRVLFAGASFSLFCGDKRRSAQVRAELEAADASARGGGEAEDLKQASR